MSWSVGPPVQVGAITFAAIAEVHVTARSYGRTLLAQGKKRPILFLISRGRTTCGVDLEGNTFDQAEIERLYPDAIARMNEQLEKA